MQGHVLCRTRLDPSDPTRPYQALEAHHQAILEESTNCWSSPTVTVPKPDGSFWISNDFHRLKHVSEMDCYLLPQVDDLVDHVMWACFILTLDLTKGYCQMALTLNARPSVQHHWQCWVHPFGLHRALSTFQRLMHVLLH